MELREGPRPSLARHGRGESAGKDEQGGRRGTILLSVISAVQWYACFRLMFLSREECAN